jgi:hypothetical protein
MRRITTGLALLAFVGIWLLGPAVTEATMQRAPLITDGRVLDWPNGDAVVTTLSTSAPLCGEIILIEYYIGGLAFSARVILPVGSDTPLVFDGTKLTNEVVGASYCYHDPIIVPQNPHISTLQGHYITEKLADWSQRTDGITPPSTAQDSTKRNTSPIKLSMARLCLCSARTGR